MESVSLPGSPTHLATAFGSLWVAVDKEDGGALVRIDPASRRVLATVPVGGFPYGIAAGFGSIWVTNYNDDTLSRIDPATNRVSATTAAGAGPAELAIAGGLVWVADDDSNLSAVDPVTNRLVRRVRVGPGPRYRTFVAAAGSIWTVSAGIGVVRVEPTGGSIEATIPIGGCCDGGLMLAAGRVWATDTVHGLACRIDPTTNRIVDHLLLGAGASGLTIAGGMLWVTHRDRGVVSWHDLRSGRQLGSNEFSGFVESLAVTDATSIWVPTFHLNVVVRLAVDASQSDPTYGEHGDMYEKAPGLVG
jgi:YVTN family beta-propeller protein